MARHHSHLISANSIFFRLCSILCIALNADVVGASDAYYKYLGCYSDSTDLKDKTMTLATMTLDECVGMCQSSGYPYAGLQSAKLCYCGSIYDVAGKSSKDCNQTCGSDKSRCGGYQTNDVYYTVDSSAALSKSLVMTSTPSSFINARMKCVSNKGDLVCPTNSGANNELIKSVSNDSSITKIWIGLYRKDTSNSSANYVWTDETLGLYSTNKSFYASFWADGDTQVSSCVSLDVRSGKWQSTDCSSNLPFVCKQAPATPVDSSTDSSAGDNKGSDGVTSDSKSLALFIVLPLFILCYGGSCVLYCVHKIIKNCNRKKHSKMNLSTVEDGQKIHAPGAREKTSNQPVPYRPLSAGKRAAVYPAPQTQLPPAALPLPAKYPLFMASPDAARKMKAGADVGDGLATSRGVNVAVPGEKEDPSSPPPKYSDPQEEKRARLLENASRESRMRREKEAEDGRPASRPFTAPKRPPPPVPPQPSLPDEGDSLAESHGSTTNLLGKKKNAPAEGGSEPPPPQDMANMSISEILKQKMAQKADKKRPRKIIAA